MRAGQRLAWCVLAAAVLTERGAAAQSLDRRQIERIDQTLRQEGQAVIALADAAARGQPVPSDFTLGWHNDFLKALTGTFVPFIVSLSGAPAPAALVYVRVTQLRADEPAVRGGRQVRSVEPEAAYAFEDVYPVEVPAEQTGPVRVTRGFSVSPGEYEVIVVARERERPGERSRRKTAAVLRRPLRVPDFTPPELTTSTVMLARRLDTLPEPMPPAAQAERPYAVGLREIHPVPEATFRQNQELIVVFLIYNPAVTLDDHFDLKVEYHFFRHAGGGPGSHEQPTGSPTVPAAQPGEQYFNRTEPQRFNPLVLGPRFKAAAGQPILAGQGVPLAGFEQGYYRLAITVTDLVSGRTIERQATFSVGS